MINILVVGDLELVKNVIIMNELNDLLKESKAIYNIRYVRSCIVRFDKVVELLSKSDLLVVVSNDHKSGPYLDDFSYFRNFDKDQRALMAYATNRRIPIIFL